MASALNPLTGRGLPQRQNKQEKQNKREKRKKQKAQRDGTEYIPPQRPLVLLPFDELHPSDGASTDHEAPAKATVTTSTTVNPHSADPAALLDEQTETVNASALDQLSTLVPAPRETANPVMAQGSPAESPIPRTIGTETTAPPKAVAERFVPFETVEQDPRHKAAIEQMEKGDWSKALLMLEQLQADYPNDSGLQMLRAEAEFKTELDDDWGDTVKGRMRTVSPFRIIGKLTAIMVAIAIMVGGFYFYYNIVVPNRAAGEVAAEFQARVDEAEYALQAGQYEKAIAYYESLVAKEPGTPTFRSGLSKAKTQLGLEHEYGAAMAVLETGDRDQARGLLMALEDKAPGYKDVASQIALLSSASDVENALQTANLAYNFKKWDQAAALYDNLRKMDGDIDANTVTARLVESSFNAGITIVNARPDSMEDLETAEGFFRKVLTLNVSDGEAKVESTLLTTFIAGQRAMDMGSLEQGIAILEPLYAERPTYLGGYLAQLLFEAYMIVGDQYMLDGDRFEAFGFFSKAADLQGVDTGEANLRLEGLEVLLTPTPTPTNTPTPAPTVPTAPPPTPAPIDMYSGWIGFKSNKDGGTGLFVMKPDGSGMRTVSAKSWEIFDRIYEAESWSPDDTTRVYAEKGPSGAVNLYKMRHDLPENWDRRLMITDFPGDDYDGKWSPANDHIVFVSNHTGNDEIWTVEVDDEKEHKQLTFNDWEWDKHPSWSPDGSHIIFYSNRSGMKQLWIMRADGSEQTQLTDGQYDYWDPVWIKPGYLAPPQ